ncbi:MAG: AraC family transcriptional regulator [Kofleriaceae bacterium]
MSHAIAATPAATSSRSFTAGIAAPSARAAMSASEVAYLVGFSEPPAFFKAFKRWTGMTPGEFQAT